MSGNLNAETFIEQLKAISSPAEAEKLARYFKTGEGQYGDGDVFMGVRMGNLFKLSEAFITMPVTEIEKLLQSNIHEVKAGALSIMNKAARAKKLPESRRKELYELYINRHDLINNWDMVDLAAIYVVGAYLFDKPRNILYQLAVSDNVWKRRTAIVSTAYFLKNGQPGDTFEIAKILLNDKHDLIHKAAGGWIRQAGKSHRQLLLSFLDSHAATMPRTMLRYAIEHLNSEERAHYLGLKK